MGSNLALMQPNIAETSNDRSVQFVQETASPADGPKSIRVPMSRGHLTNRVCKKVASSVNFRAGPCYTCKSCFTAYEDRPTELTGTELGGSGGACPPRARAAKQKQQTLLSNRKQALKLQLSCSWYGKDKQHARLQVDACMACDTLLAGYQ